MTAPILPPTEQAIERAVRILRGGGLVAIPTETVYGLAADASNPVAVARLYDVKGRPSFNPLIAHVSSLQSAEIEGQFSNRAKDLASTFWPGPLTQVVNTTQQTKVCDLARAGLSTLAIRVPAHPAARSVLAGFGGPLVAPSANPSGRLSPTEARHVSADLGKHIDLILDGGSCEIGLESTIVDARADHLTILRHGIVTADQIEEVWPSVEYSEGNSDAPSAPGQLLRHYAPDARLSLDQTEPTAGGAMLGFGPIDGTLNLSRSANLLEAAANLFSMLRTLDRTYDTIAVAPIPPEGLGLAINDRLRRAAAD